MMSKTKDSLALSKAGATAGVTQDASAKNLIQDTIVSESKMLNPFASFANVKDFTEAKTKLGSILDAAGESELAEWLKAFNISLDDRTAAAIMAAGNNLMVESPTPRLMYEPQLVEDLLSSASALLDQALSYRNELANLEVNGISVAMQHYITTNSAKIAENIADIASQADIAKKIQQTKSDAAIKHSDEGDKIQSEGAAEVAQLFETKEITKTALAKQQISLIIDSQKLLLKQLTSSGSGLNYSQRYLRLLKYFLEDVSEAYQKCQCASLCLGNIYGIKNQTIPRFTLNSTPNEVNMWASEYLKSSPLSQTKDGGVIDALVDWCRRSIREIEQVQQNEVEYTVIIPAVQGWTLSTTPSADPKVRTPLVGVGALGLAMAELQANSTIIFNIIPEHLSEEKFKNIRVIGVGMNVVSKDKFGIFSAIVSSPPQKNTLINSYTRPPVVLGKIRSSVGNDGSSIIDPEISFQDACRNVDPFGKWSAKIRVRAVKYDAATTTLARSTEQIAEVFLHLRIRATFESF